MIRLIILFLITFPLSASPDSLNKLEGNCVSGIHKLSESPFSVHISCEGALGNYIGVIMTGLWSRNGNKYWDIGDRFWFQKDWGNDVTSLYFHEEKNTLYVSTSSFYGKGGLYKLDLDKKKAILFYPKKDTLIESEEFIVIESVKKESKLMKLKRVADGKINYVELDLKDSK